MNQSTNKYTFKIFRYDPERSPRARYDTFSLEVAKGMTVLDCLQAIKASQDGTLSFRRSCRSAICGSCAMNINGKNDLACHLQVSLLGGRTVTVDPLPGFPVIRDLVVDLEEFYRSLERVLPWLVRSSPFPDKELPQSPAERDRIDSAVNCILCGSCTSSCPSFWFNTRYLAPAALLKAYRFIFDSRDEAKGERLELVDDRNGLWRCRTIYNCEEACPKLLKPNEAIAALKIEALKQSV
ncbi:MAG: succinate dehydrogenase iron-sulfur subunit [Candidatus Aureabacteria bacterium]|nr:succinate dehydrogenase iron-sulfur subunit [Candidatus Auribacterota bacterium]